MAKRMAGQQINHENWDDADEPEEAGQFKQVPVVNEWINFK
jgi:NUP50 (Nucleoporin 50 kDa)